MCKNAKLEKGNGLSSSGGAFMVAQKTIRGLAIEPGQSGALEIKLAADGYKEYAIYSRRSPQLGWSGVGHGFTRDSETVLASIPQGIDCGELKIGLKDASGNMQELGPFVIASPVLQTQASRHNRQNGGWFGALFGCVAILSGLSVLTRVE